MYDGKEERLIARVISYRVPEDADDMRILYHHRTRAEDAQGVHIRAVVHALRELGHEVCVVSLVGGEETGPARPATRPSRARRAVEASPAWLYELMSLSYNAYGYTSLVRRGREFGAELLYERYSLNTVCGVWAARRLGIPMLLEVNAPLAYEQETLGRLSFRRLAHFTERWTCSHSTRTIVVSEVMKTMLVAAGVPAHHMVVMPNGVDPSRFHPRIPGDAVRHRYQLTGKVVIGFVGWFRKWHGLELLVEAFHEAGLAGRGARLLLVGDGPARQDLVQYVADHGLEHVVRFTGPVAHEEIPAHVAAMDVTVQPSAVEYACPMKIIEYMAMGKCIVGPDQPNIREVVRAGWNGLLFAAGSKPGLRAALLEAVKDSARRESLGARGVETVQSMGLLWKANAQRALALAKGATR